MEAAVGDRAPILPSLDTLTIDSSEHSASKRGIEHKPDSPTPNHVAPIHAKKGVPVPSSRSSAPEFVFPNDPRDAHLYTSVAYNEEEPGLNSQSEGEEEEAERKDVDSLPFDMRELEFCSNREEEWALRVNELSRLLQRHGSEEQWLRLMKADDDHLLRTVSSSLVNVLTSAPHLEKAILNLAQTLFLFRALDSVSTDRYVSFHPVANTLLRHVSVDRSDAYLVAVLRLARAILMAVDNTEARGIDFEDPTTVIASVYSVLNCESAQVFDLGVDVFLLVSRSAAIRGPLLDYAIGREQTSYLSQAVIERVNRIDVDSKDCSLLLTSLQLVHAVFAQKRYDFFYTNDIYVLLDVLLRRITDLSSNNPNMVFFVRVLCTVLGWRDYAERLYKFDELMATLVDVDENYARDPEVRQIIDKALGRLQFHFAESKKAVSS